MGFYRLFRDSVVNIVKNLFAGLNKTELVSCNILDCFRVCAVVDRVLKLGVRLKDTVHLSLQFVARFARVRDLVLE